MAVNKTRVILDTNVWISYLISGNQNLLDPLLLSKRVKLVFSQELLQEFIEVASRPKFRPFFQSSSIIALLKSIRSIAEIVEVYSEITICRDPKDNFVLALAKDGKVDILVTGDKDLLELRHFNNTRIVTIEAFINSVPK